MKRDFIMDRIFDVSRDMFLEHGYDAVTVNDICSELHITKPTFYACQLQKEDLLCHMFERDLETEYPFWDLCPDRNWLAGIGRGVDMLIDRCVATSMDLWRSYLRICMEGGRTPVNIQDEWRQKMVRLIEKAQRDQQIVNTEPADEILHCMLIYMMGVSYRLCMDEDVSTVYEKVHQGVDTILQSPSQKILNLH